MQMLSALQRGTGFARFVTDHDHIVKSLVAAEVNGLGALTRNVRFELAHDLNGQRVQLTSRRPGAANFISATGTRI
jgi:hypothetical protein